MSTVLTQSLFSNFISKESTTNLFCSWPYAATAIAANAAAVQRSFDACFQQGGEKSVRIKGNGILKRFSSEGFSETGTSLNLNGTVFERWTPMKINSR